MPSTGIVKVIRYICILRTQMHPVCEGSFKITICYFKICRIEMYCDLSHTAKKKGANRILISQVICLYNSFDTDMKNRSLVESKYDLRLFFAVSQSGQSMAKSSFSIYSQCHQSYLAPEFAITCIAQSGLVCHMHLC